MASQREQYLEAIGIDLWVPRQWPVAPAAPAMPSTNTKYVPAGNPDSVSESPTNATGFAPPLDGFQKVAPST